MRINLLHAHGSPTGYLYRQCGCRCTACSAEQANRSKRWRQTNPEAVKRNQRQYRQDHLHQITEANRRYRRDHPHQIAKAAGQYRKDHLHQIAKVQKRRRLTAHDHDAEVQRHWRAENPEKVRENLRRYRAAHPERVAEYLHRYYEKHREEQGERQRIYREANREKVREKDRLWRKAHPAECAANSNRRRARKINAHGTHTAADVQAQYKRQRGRCFWCHEKVVEYHVDHVVPLILGGSNGPENLVIACPACNQRKHAKHPMDFAGVLL